MLSFSGYITDQVRSKIQNDILKTETCQNNPGIILNEAFDPTEIYEITVYAISA